MPVESQVILMEVIAMLDDGASTRGKITPQGGTLADGRTITEADGRTITEAILGIKPDERNRLKVAW